MVTKGIDPWQSALFIREQRLRLKATIACFGAVHNLLFGERNNSRINKWLFEMNRGPFATNRTSRHHQWKLTRNLVRVSCIWSRQIPLLFNPT